MSRKEYGRDIKRIMKAVEDRDVQFRKDGILIDGFQGQVQKNKKQAKSMPRATN